MTGARVALAALVLSTGPVTSLTLAGSPKGIVVTAHPAHAGVAVHWSVKQSDDTSISGTTKTDANGRVIVEVTGTALVSGTVDVRAGSVHARASYCFDPHDVAVVHDACYADFTGRWTGDYTGTFFGQNGCPSWEIDGPVHLELTQRGHSITGTITLIDSALQLGDNCQVLSRSEDIAQVNAAVAGRAATGGTLSLSMDDGLTSLHGAVNAVAGSLTFTATRY